MADSTTYATIGHCIYCRRVEYAENNSRRLGNEHIIPEALNGNLLFCGASCQRCERVTGHIETSVCGHHLVGPRWSLGLKSKSPPNKRKGTIPIYAVDDGVERRVEIEIKDFPSALLLLRMGPPPLLRALIGSPPEEAAEITPWFHWFHYDQGVLAEKYGVGSFAATRVNFRFFCRMLAKIGHSYALATLGQHRFTPLLHDMIRDEDYTSRALMAFVGCNPGENTAPVEGVLHQIENGMAKSSDGRRFHIVRVRLFANLGSPSYVIVVGTPKELKIPPPPPGIGVLDARHNFYRIHVPSQASLPIQAHPSDQDATSSN